LGKVQRSIKNAGLFYQRGHQAGKKTLKLLVKITTNGGLRKIISWEGHGEKASGRGGGLKVLRRASRRGGNKFLKEEKDRLSEAGAHWDWEGAARTDHAGTLKVPIEFDGTKNQKRKDDQ